MESLLGILLSTAAQLAGCFVLVALISVGVNWLVQRGRSARRPVLPVVPPDRFETYLKQANVYKIALPKNTPWQPERAKVLVEHLLFVASSNLFLRIVAEGGRVNWQVIVGPAGVLRNSTQSDSPNPDTIAQAIQSIYPDAEVSVEDFQFPAFSNSFWRAAVSCQLGRDAHVPVKQVMDMKHLDPLVSLVQAMSVGLGEGRSTFTIYIDRFADEKDVKAEFGKLRKMNPLYQFGGGWISGLIKGDLWVDKYHPEMQSVCEAKLNSEQLCWAWVMLQVDATDKHDLQRRSNLIEVIEGQYSGSYSGYVTTPGPEHEVTTATKAHTADVIGDVGSWLADSRWRQAQILLNMSELAGLWHLPHQAFASTQTAWIMGGQVPAALLDNNEGVVLGSGTLAGRAYPVRLRYEDRETHLSIVGKTGTGKSTFMHNLIHQDIANGKGVGVIDPHGNLVQAILRSSIPDNRIKDVVVIDIANEEHPPPLNLISVPGERGTIAAGQVIAVLDKVYGFDDAKRAATVLDAALMTLWQEETPTLRDVVRLFSSSEYRYRLLESLDDTNALEFWEMFEKKSPREQEQWTSPVEHRMRSLYGNKTLYPMMCHPDTLNWSEFITSGKILLVSLHADSKKVSSKAQRLLGAVLVSQLQMAAMSLAAPSAFYLYIDEVQEFVTTSLQDMFAEVRKRGMSLTVANQYLGQLKGSTLDAIMGTVGAMMVFQVSADSARELRTHFEPQFTQEDLVNLSKYQLAAKVRLGGRALPAFSLDTHGPVVEPKDASEREKQIRSSSEKNYTPRHKSDVMAWLENRYPRPTHLKSKHKKGVEPKTDDWIVGPESN